MSATELPEVAPRFPVRIAGWHLTAAGDFAAPASAGGGYCEMGDDGTLEVAWEPDQGLRDLGAPDYGLTKIPVDVLRALLDAHDAKGEASATIEYLRIAAPQVALAIATADGALDMAEIAHDLESMARAARRLVSGVVK